MGFMPLSVLVSLCLGGQEFLLSGFGISLGYCLIKIAAEREGMCFSVVRKQGRQDTHLKPSDFSLHPIMEEGRIFTISQRTKSKEIFVMAALHLQPEITHLVFKSLYSKSLSVNHLYLYNLTKKVRNALGDNN